MIIFSIHILPVFFQETNMPPEFKENNTFVRLKLEDLFKYIAQNENEDGFIINLLVMHN